MLPNCDVAAASGEFLLGASSPLESDGVVGFQARFSEHIATVRSFMEANPDAKVINISLGYNWMPNFGVDSRTNENAEVRDLMRGAGEFGGGENERTALAGALANHFQQITLLADWKLNGGSLTPNKSIEVSLVPVVVSEEVHRGQHGAPTCRTLPRVTRFFILAALVGARDLSEDHRDERQSSAVCSGIMNGLRPDHPVCHRPRPQGLHTRE
ncbi:MAG: hypothetical protein HXY23_01165 [Parvularculaceae bacterium]|nr:hypothetical protein [Parvularculaceae bacterium]